MQNSSDRWIEIGCFIFADCTIALVGRLHRICLPHMPRLRPTAVLGRRVALLPCVRCARSAWFSCYLSCFRCLSEVCWFSACMLLDEQLVRETIKSIMADRACTTKNVLCTGCREVSMASRFYRMVLAVRLIFYDFHNLLHMFNPNTCSSI